MRIIAGKWGSYHLKSSRKINFHPMSERIRSAIFNKMFGEIQDKKVLDAFAGSGSLGFEALSRGAEQVIFIDSNYQAIKKIQENLDNLKIKHALAHKATVLRWIENNHDKYQFDVIFADPPYHKLQPNSVVALARILNSGGWLILSNPKSEPAIKIAGLKKIDERIYADAKIIFYKKP